jgi:hypothetical protein
MLVLVVFAELEFYTNFVGKHPKLLCSLSSYETLKLWWVKRLLIWNTCCSRSPRTNKVDDCNWHHEDGQEKNIFWLPLQMFHCLWWYSLWTYLCMCNVYCKTFERLNNLWASILYKKGELSMWHKRECLLDECLECGLELFRVCPWKLDLRNLWSGRVMGT